MVEINVRLKYMDDVVCIISQIYVLGFNHISGGVCASCGYFLYAGFYLLRKTGGTLFLDGKL